MFNQGLPLPDIALQSMYFACVCLLGSDGNAMLFSHLAEPLCTFTVYILKWITLEHRVTQMIYMRWRYSWHIALCASYIFSFWPVILLGFLNVNSLAYMGSSVNCVFLSHSGFITNHFPFQLDKDGCVLKPEYGTSKCMDLTGVCRTN